MISLALNIGPYCTIHARQIIRNSGTLVISTKPTSQPGTVTYDGPTLDELVQLCIDFELISDIRRIGGRIKIRVREEYFDVNYREAGILVRGLLLGSFALQTKEPTSPIPTQG